MKWYGMVSLVLGIFLVLAIIVTMQGLLAGGDWETVGQILAPTILALGVFGFVASVAFYLLRK